MTSALSDLPVPLDLEPMEARQADMLPDGEGWVFEPKWDGFRCLVFRSGDRVELKAKSGKSLVRFFPEVAVNALSWPGEAYVLDGELLIAAGESNSFDALQMRLHPAESRIRRLSAETPARLMAFDCLCDDGVSLLERPFIERGRRLRGFSGAGLEITRQAGSREEARGWLDHLTSNLDGVVAKRADEPYRPGERAMIKVKRLRSADCVVGGFRYESASDLVGSLLLGLYSAEGRLDHVGYTSTITDAERPALTRRLEALVGAPGFDGDAPGGPSRWSTGRSAEWKPLRPELVVEVRYDHVSSGRFRHGTKLLRWRPDKAPRQCDKSQIGLG